MPRKAKAAAKVIEPADIDPETSASSQIPDPDAPLPKKRGRAKKPEKAVEVPEHAEPLDEVSDAGKENEVHKLETITETKSQRGTTRGKGQVRGKSAKNKVTDTQVLHEASDSRLVNHAGNVMELSDPDQNIVRSSDSTDTKADPEPHKSKSKRQAKGKVMKITFVDAEIDATESKNGDAEKARNQDIDEPNITTESQHVEHAGSVEEILDQGKNIVHSSSTDTKVDLKPPKSKGKRQVKGKGTKVPVVEDIEATKSTDIESEKPMNLEKCESNISTELQLAENVGSVMEFPDPDQDIVQSSDSGKIKSDPKLQKTKSKRQAKGKVTNIVDAEIKATDPKNVDSEKVKNREFDETNSPAESQHVEPAASVEGMQDQDRNTDIKVDAKLQKSKGKRQVKGKVTKITAGEEIEATEPTIVKNEGATNQKSDEVNFTSESELVEHTENVVEINNQDENTVVLSASTGKKADHKLQKSKDNRQIEGKGKNITTDAEIEITDSLIVEPEYSTNQEPHGSNDPIESEHSDKIDAQIIQATKSKIGEAENAVDCEVQDNSLITDEFSVDELTESQIFQPSNDLERTTVIVDPNFVEKPTESGGAEGSPLKNDTEQLLESEVLAADTVSETGDSVKDAEESEIDESVYNLEKENTEQLPVDNNTPSSDEGIQPGNTRIETSIANVDVAEEVADSDMASSAIEPDSDPTKNCTDEQRSAEISGTRGDMESSINKDDSAMDSRNYHHDEIADNTSGEVNVEGEAPLTPDRDSVHQENLQLGEKLKSDCEPQQTKLMEKPDPSLMPGSVPDENEELNISDPSTKTLDATFVMEQELPNKASSRPKRGRPAKKPADPNSTFVLPDADSTFVIEDGEEETIKPTRKGRSRGKKGQVEPGTSEMDDAATKPVRKRQAKNDAVTTKIQKVTANKSTRANKQGEDFEDAFSSVKNKKLLPNVETKADMDSVDSDGKGKRGKKAAAKTKNSSGILKNGTDANDEATETSVDTKALVKSTKPETTRTSRSKLKQDQLVEANKEQMECKSDEINIAAKPRGRKRGKEAVDVGNVKTQENIIEDVKGHASGTTQADVKPKATKRGKGTKTAETSESEAKTSTTTRGAKKTGKVTKATVAGSKEEAPKKKRRVINVDIDLDMKQLMLTKTATRGNKFLGAHVSITGGLWKAVTEAAQLGARAFGLFLKAQRQWKCKPLEDEDAQLFRNVLKDYGFSPFMVVPHGSYLMNCASPKAELLDKSRAMLIDELQRCDKLGLTIFNFHPGSTCGEISTEEGIELIAESINMALDQTEHVTAVIENMCGQGHTIGGRFSELAGIIECVENKARIGVCLDTCHTFAAGYDIRSPEAYQKTMEEFDKVVGFKYLKAVHLNDSKGDLGCHKDAHENIGEGYLGMETFSHFMNDPRFDNIPMILETPDTDYTQEILALNKLLE